MISGTFKEQQGNDSAARVRTRRGESLLGLSRNLGLITAAPLMGMVLALGADVLDVRVASSSAIMRPRCGLDP